MGQIGGVREHGAQRVASQVGAALEHLLLGPTAREAVEDELDRHSRSRDNRLAKGDVRIDGDVRRPVDDRFALEKRFSLLVAHLLDDEGLVIGTFHWRAPKSSFVRTYRRA